MRRTILIIMIALFAGLGTLQSAGPEAEVRNAERDWAAAVVAHDYAALEQILADQLIYAHSTGTVESKKEYLEKLRSNAQRYDVIKHASMKVKVYGDAAVTHSMVRMTGESGDEPFDNQLMMMHLWVMQDGNWRLAAHQTTMLP